LERHVKLAKWPTPTRKYICTLFFAVSGRACVVASSRREELQKYITGIVTRKGQKLIVIYCIPDHTMYCSV
jgi:hypothetical protein